MKRYRLKKDIPGYKAGEIYSWDDGWGLRDSEGRVVYSAVTISRCPDIMDWFEEVRNEWVPDKGEEYYSFDEAGNVHCFNNYDQSATDGSIAIGNCFRTREEVEKAVERLKALARLRAHNFRFTSWDYDRHAYYDLDLYQGYQVDLATLLLEP